MESLCAGEAMLISTNSPNKENFITMRKTKFQTSTLMIFSEICGKTNEFIINGILDNLNLADALDLPVKVILRV